MHYLIYKTTNLVNSKIYIGCHITENIDDEYFGSGVILKKSIKKYGIINFKKEILFELNSKEEMFEKEREIVNNNFVESFETYNIKEGGKGGWPQSCVDWRISKENRELHRRLGKENTEDFLNRTEKWRNSKENHLRLKELGSSEKNIERLKKTKNSLLRKKWRESKECKEVLEKARKKRNPFKWMNRNGLNKQVYSIQCDEMLLEGWILGRLISKEQSRKTKQTMIDKPLLKCPHCGKMSNSNVMKRWHFDNCSVNSERYSVIN